MRIKLPPLFDISLYQQKILELHIEGRKPFDARWLFNTTGIGPPNTLTKTLWLGCRLFPGTLARVPHLRGLPPNRPVAVFEGRHCSECSFESVATLVEEILHRNGLPALYHAVPKLCKLFFTVDESPGT
jgi:hypothetical protein